MPAFGAPAFAVPPFDAPPTPEPPTEAPAVDPPVALEPALFFAPPFPATFPLLVPALAIPLPPLVVPGESAPSLHAAKKSATLARRVDDGNPSREASMRLS
jgi:hypothetical protein